MAARGEVKAKYSVTSGPFPFPLGERVLDFQLPMERRAIIMAGGKGRRLLPYTAVLPKPLMPVGERPILEIVVRQLRRAGFGRVTIAVGYLASLVQAYFGDGGSLGVRIDYSLEPEPLGTAGPLALLTDLNDDALVMNGDVLTDLDFAAMLAAHRGSGALATVAVFAKQMDVALGVVDTDAGGRVTRYTEKPRLNFDVSTGIYCIRPQVTRFLRRGERCDLPELVARMLAADESVRAFRIDGTWLDIGRPEDYEVAQREHAGLDPLDPL